MREAVIVSTARTGIAKAFRGSFNMTHGATMAGAAAQAAVERASIDPALIEDCIIGCGFPEGVAGSNIARQIAIRAGLPVTTCGMTINRFCSSGLQAVALAAHRIVEEGTPAVLAGGLECISQIPAASSQGAARDPWIDANKPEIYMAMIDTADVVAARYGISRQRQDEYGYQSQQRTANAQSAGKFEKEIIPVTTTMGAMNKETGQVTTHEVTISADECNRPSTTLDGLAGLQAVRGPDRFITAGNASQLSDGAAALVVMDAKVAEKSGLEPLGAFRGFTVAGCEPDEMGIGPVFAVPRLLERTGHKMDDIDLWELNEAFASQVLYCQDRLGIPADILNVNGGSIAIGHPYGMTGARQVGHVLLEGKRRGAKKAIVTMCIGGGQGAAGLIEIF
ncbi:MAG: acetyl-CoA C-acyltransferase [Anderseniella sp.]